MKPLFLTTIALLFIMPVLALAHKAIVFAWVEGGVVYTESSFGGDRKAKQCALMVTDENGNVIIKGKTDEHGNFSFPVPEKIRTDLTVTLDAGTGHKAVWQIPLSELNPSPGGEQTPEGGVRDRDRLKKEPSILRIAAGIAVIALIAFLARIAMKRMRPL